VRTSRAVPAVGTDAPSAQTLQVYLRTYGCRANHYDTEAVRALVESSGGRIVQRPEDADVAVFNSCAVTHQAEVDLRKGVRQAARRRPGLRTIIMGCASALDQGALGDLPSVTGVVAGADLGAVAASLGLSERAESFARIQSTTRALLRIQDGCDEHCTFCATTLARGPNRSRPAARLVEEAGVLAERHPEIVITGIHIGTWGRDIGSSLGALMQTLIRDVPGVRFRLSSVEATEVDEELFDTFAHPRQLAPHLHAPLQSGSAAVLRRMGRHWYTPSSYVAALERLMANRPVFALGADVIAGFPGESDEDHRRTMELVVELPFSYLHVFPYSLRPGTAAERLAGHLEPQVVEWRARELRELGAQKIEDYGRRRIGGPADLVVQRGPARGGLTEDYLSVRLLSEEVLPGERLDVRLGGEPGSLTATPNINQTLTARHPS
jgi:threonylcarbamoyladenosine tRNA methylthiotransferase MtaB